MGTITSWYSHTPKKASVACGRQVLSILPPSFAFSKHVCILRSCLFYHYVMCVLTAHKMQHKLTLTHHLKLVRNILTVVFAVICTTASATATGELEQLHTIVHSQEAQIGETVVVPIEVEIPSNVAGTVSRCRISLLYPKSSLVCLADSSSDFLGAHTALSTLTLTVETTESNLTKALFNVPFLVVLGETESIEIALFDVEWEMSAGNWVASGDDDFEYELTTGSIDITDVYVFQDGSKRLLQLPFATAHAGPNPFSEQTLLHVANPSGPVTCAVYNVRGELVYDMGTLPATEGRSEHHIQLSSAYFPSTGTYFVVVSNGDELSTFRLLLR